MGTSEFVYNWDGRLRSGQSGNKSISIKYDPVGNQVWKQSSDGQTTTARKYIVDIVGDLPVILLEIGSSEK